MTGRENAEPLREPAHRHPRRWRLVAAAALLFALFAAVSEYAYHFAAAGSLREHRARVAAAATRLHDAIEIELNATVHLATGLTAYLQVRKLIDKPAEVMAMLQNLVSYGRHIRNIAIAPGNRLSYVYPEKGNEKAIGLYYPDVPSQWPAIERTIRERKPRLAGPLTLVQGGTGLIYRVPVFLEDGSYWGIISTVVDADRLFAAVGLATDGQDIRYALRGRDGLGAAGEVFFGDAGLFAADAAVIDIDVPGGRWQLAAMPVEGWRVSPQILWLRHAGWLIAVLLAFLLYQRLEGDRRRALLAEARHASEERYRNLFTRSEVAMLLVDPASGEIVEANDAAVAYYGYTAEQLCRLRIFDINMLTAGEITAEMARAGREHRNHFHFVHRLANGELRDVEVRSGPIEVEGRQLLYSIVFDVTERYRLEEERRRLALAVEQSPSAIVITDPQGRIEYVNAAFCRTTGYTVEEAVGRNPRMVQSGETPEEVYTAMWQALTAGRPWHGVFRNRRKSGELFWEQVHISPVIDEMGAVTHYLGIKEDITARIEAEAELVKAKEAAEAASRVKSQFLANMSHEIRTPMNGIIGMTHLLLETPLSDDQREFAKIVRSSAESLLGIINDILDFSKVEAGRLEIASAPLAPRVLLREVADLFAGQVAEKGLALNCTVADEVPGGVVGDAGRLRQVLVNLVGNAVKFTSRGTVEVTLGVAGAGAAPRLVFTVRDTGIGMGPEVVAGLFAPFFQGDASTTRRFGGTGLGLSISKRLVELMGGGIQVASTPGGGSVFSFDLPLEAVDLAPAEPSAGRGDVRLMPDARILVVEDNATNRTVALRLLARFGVDARTADNGSDAIELLRRESFDLVLMDCQMPVMDGYEATRRIRAGAAGAANAGIAVIAMTANAMAGDREACLAAGMNDYVAKPVALEELARRLETWLPAGRTSAGV